MRLLLTAFAHMQQLNDQILQACGSLRKFDRTIGKLDETMGRLNEDLKKISSSLAIFVPPAQTYAEADKSGRDNQGWFSKLTDIVGFLNGICGILTFGRSVKKGGKPSVDGPARKLWLPDTATQPSRSKSGAGSWIKNLKLPSLSFPLGKGKLPGTGKRIISGSQPGFSSGLQRVKPGAASLLKKINLPNISNPLKTAVPKVGSTLLKAAPLVSRGLTRFIPYVGWALLAADVIKAIMNYGKPKGPEAASIIKDQSLLKPDHRNNNYPALPKKGERAAARPEPDCRQCGGGNITIARLADTIIVRKEADIDRVARAVAIRLKNAQLNYAGRGA